MIVRSYNDSPTEAMTFRIGWGDDGGGETPATDNCPQGQNVQLDLDDLGPLKIPQGASCYAIADNPVGPNHSSSQNFDYVPGDGEVVYQLTGTVDDLSFSME